MLMDWSSCSGRVRPSGYSFGNECRVTGGKDARGLTATFKGVTAAAIANAAGGGVGAAEEASFSLDRCRRVRAISIPSLPRIIAGILWRASLVSTPISL